MNCDKDKVKQIAESFISLSKEEKQEFIKITREHFPDWDFDNYENPQTTKENIKELQEKMVQLCIDYLNEHGLNDVDEVRFSADMLQFSKKQGEWTPMTDSFITVYGFQKDERDVEVRKFIGEYC